MDLALQQLSEGAEDTGINTFNLTLKIPWSFHWLVAVGDVAWSLGRGFQCPWISPHTSSCTAYPPTLGRDASWFP